MLEAQRSQPEYEIFMFLRPFAGAIGCADGRLADYVDLAVEKKVNQVYSLRTLKVLFPGYLRARSREADKIRSSLYEEIDKALEEDDSVIFNPDGGNGQGIRVTGKTPEVRALKRTHIKNKLDSILGIHIIFENK